MTTEEQFEIFWRSFPRRIAKANARKAFAKAIKLTTLEVMLDAITKYVSSKPDWQDYSHPASWLNGGRWEDEWEPQQAKPQKYKDSFVPYNIEKYCKPTGGAITPVLPKNHFLNTYGKRNGQ